MNPEIPYKPPTVSPWSHMNEVKKAMSQVPPTEMEPRADSDVLAELSIAIDLGKEALQAEGMPDEALVLFEKSVLKGADPKTILDAILKKFKPAMKQADFIPGGE